MKQFFSFVAAIVCAAACNHVNDSNICIIEGNLSGLDGDGWISVRGELYSPEWKAYMADGLPTTVLIDCSTGLIVGRDLIGDMLTTKLDELMH